MTPVPHAPPPRYSFVVLGVIFFALQRVLDLILQCMLHWRFALNGNATVKGTGTWQSVEDERMLSLVQVTIRGTYL